MLDEPQTDTVVAEPITTPDTAPMIAEPVLVPIHEEVVPVPEVEQVVTIPEPVIPTATVETITDPIVPVVAETISAEPIPVQAVITPVPEAAPEPVAEIPLVTMPAVPPMVASSTVSVESPRNIILAILAKGKAAIQFRKRRKVEKIMTMFANKSQISNDQVEKLLHVSHATATRYLDILEKEGRIRQSGNTGKGVVYTKL